MWHGKDFVFKGSVEAHSVEHRVCANSKFRYLFCKDVPDIRFRPYIQLFFTILFWFQTVKKSDNCTSLILSLIIH